MMQQTSLDNYRNLKTVTKRQLVKSAIASSDLGLTDREIVDITGLTINCVTARRNELVATGEVFKAGTTVCLVSGKRSNNWMVDETVKEEKILKRKYCKSFKFSESEIRDLIECLKDSVNSKSEMLIQRLGEQWVR